MQIAALYKLTPMRSPEKTDCPRFFQSVMKVVCQHKQKSVCEKWRFVTVRVSVLGFHTRSHWLVWFLFALATRRALPTRSCYQPLLRTLLRVVRPKRLRMPEREDRL
eukprot:Rmarinus@m.9232